MPIRLILLALVIGSLSIYAWKDWFKSLCAAIVLMAFLELPDMPRTIAGVQGLNPWNILMLSVVAAWLTSRRFQGLKWDLPRLVSALFWIYMGVVLVGVVRALMDPEHLRFGIAWVISERLINTLKWVLPAILLFDGCRTRRNMILAVCCILLTYCLIASRVVQCVPLRALSDPLKLANSRLKLNHRAGYHASDLSSMLAGAIWGIIAFTAVFRRKRVKAALLLVAFACTVALALTGGRVGFIAWSIVGLALCMVRWRKALLLAPLAPVLLAMVFPAAADRMLQGIGKTDQVGDQITDEYEVTSGRNLFWPEVIDEIRKSPLLGHGQLAMERTGLTNSLLMEFGQGEAVTHPHNAYLEWLLDNGIVGLVPVLLFYAVVLVYSARLFRDPNPWCMVIGALSLSLVLAQLAAGLGGQHFYPREGTMGMWAAIFLMLRVYVERSRVRGFEAQRVVAPGTAQTQRVRLPAIS